MTEYYTNFSCHLDLRTTDQVKQALELFRTFSEELESEGIPTGFVASIDIEPHTTRLWIHSEDHGDPENVIKFVKRCAGAFELDGRWRFQWADSCTRPVRDAFGGGAHVVDLASGETVDWCDTHTWLAIVLDGGDPNA